jgi:hypothetical protein
MSLNNFSDFIQVIYSIRKHYTTNEYFSYAYYNYHNLFIAGTEFKSWKLFRVGIKYGQFCTS